MSLLKPVISIVGLPSAGKSTLINSLLLKKVLSTGVCRTTTNIKTFGIKLFDLDFYECNLISDDGVNYNIIDFPGVSDFEDKNSEYDKIVNKYIIETDVILWLTSLETAFLTKYENEHFESLCRLIENEQLKTGKLYQIGIVITKCNEDYLNMIHDENANIKDEWDDDETTLIDCVKRLFKMYGEKYEIMLFNSFGRIKERENVNIRKFKNINVTNTNFNIKWMINDIYEKEQKVIYDSLNYNYKIDREIKVDAFYSITKREYSIEIINRFLNYENFNESLMVFMELDICNNLKIKLKEMNVKNIITGETLVLLSKILGFNNHEYKKIYFENFIIIGDFSYEWNGEKIKFIDLNLHLTENFKLHELDQKLVENGNLIVRNKFIEEVKNERSIIYGKDQEEDIDVRTLVMLFSDRKIYSVLENITHSKPRTKVINNYKNDFELWCRVNAIELPEEIRQLISLDLSECSNLKNISKGIGELTNLTNLNFKRCMNLEELPKEIGQLTNLTFINLNSFCNLKELPKEIGQLINLTGLNLSSFCNLEKLPKEIGQLTNLTNLDLSICSKLEKLPKEIGQLTNLTNLDLRNCSKLKELPKEIGQLTNLTSLNLRDCKNLEELPNEIGQLTNLTDSSLCFLKYLKETSERRNGINRRVNLK